jgi:hypothetical protein
MEVTQFAIGFLFQLWLTRAALLMKLHMFTAVEAELEGG